MDFSSCVFVFRFKSSIVLRFLAVSLVMQNYIRYTQDSLCNQETDLRLI